MQIPDSILNLDLRAERVIMTEVMGEIVEALRELFVAQEQWIEWDEISWG